MAHDVFICHSSKDKTIADAACAKLEGAGIRCWIAPRDPVPGKPYSAQIVDAIAGAKILLLIFSSNANVSDDVLREIHIASDRKALILLFKVDDCKPSAGLEYYTGAVHWLDAIGPPLEAHLTQLVSLVRRLLDVPVPQAPQAPQTPQDPLPAAAARRATLFRPLSLAVIAAVVLSAVLVFTVRNQHAGSGPIKTTTVPRVSPPPLIGRGLEFKIMPDAVSARSVAALGDCAASQQNAAACGFVNGGAYNASGAVVYSGKDLKNVRPGFSQNGQPELDFETKDPQKFEALTRKNIGRTLAVFFSKRLLSSATIEGVISGTGVIHGSFTEKQVQDMADEFNRGAGQ